MNKFSFFINHKKKILLAGVLLLALSLPFVVNQVLKQQDIRQRANTAPAINFTFTPAKRDLALNDTLKLDLIMNAGTNDVGSIVFKVKYDNTKLQFLFSDPANSGLTLSHKIQNGGENTFFLVNESDTPITGNNINIHTLTFKAIGTGNSQVKVETGIESTARSFNTFVPVENPDKIIAIIDIYDPAISPTPACTETNKALTCVCTQDSQCASQKCSPIQSTPDISVCVPYLSPVPTNTPTLTSSPTPTACQTNTGRPNSCQCANDGQCASGYCNYPVPGPTGAEEVGLCQVRPTNPPSSTPTLTKTPTPTLTKTPTPMVTNTPAPTATLTPTATIVPNETRIKLSTSLLGIGLGNGDNPTPVTPNRPVTIQIFNSSNVKVFDANGILVYKPANGRYEGTVSLGTNFTTGFYYVKLKFNNSLFKRLPGIVQITKESDQNVVPYDSVVSGDLNGDNTLTIADYTMFVDCYKNRPSCTQDVKNKADFNDDGKKSGDDIDLNILQRGFAIRDGD